MSATPGNGLVIQPAGMRNLLRDLKRSAMLLGAGLLLLLAFAAPSSAREVRVGVYDNPPKIFAKGDVADGILIELLEEVARREGWSLRFVPCEWQDCLVMLEAGSLDLMPDVAWTDERASLFAFHRIPALHSWSQVFRRPDETFDSIMDLDGKRVAILGGSVQEQAFESMLEGFGVNLSLIAAQSPEEALRLVAERQADAAAVSRYFGEYRAGSLGLVETPIMFQPASLFYASGKGRNADLLAALDRHLAEWRANPGSPFFSILRRWSAPAPQILLPDWTRNVLLALVVTGIVALVGVVALRSQVQERTRALERLGRLYATLSQCNQAIVRCSTEAELLPQICRDAVEHGGMAMAWIGMLDEDGALLRPVASYGAGDAYVDGLHIVTDPDDASGRGPTGTAVREDRPCWCQDFLNDPATAPWHARGRQYGWRASAALPLHREGRVVGAISLYASERDAFDEAARGLLQEMAMDVDFAFERFRRDAERERLVDEIAEREAKYRILTETINDVIWVMDPESLCFLYVSPSVKRLRGYTPEEIMAQPMDAALTPEGAQRVRGRITASLAEFNAGKRGPEDFEIVELQQPCKDGSTVWTEVVTNFACNPRSGKVEIHGVTRDISERKLAEARIQHLAHFDHLTGLPNRTLLKDRFQYAVSLAHRESEPMAVMFLDLDHFKNINDTLGHDVGDRLLVEVAKRLSGCLRAVDTVSRPGGDEFVFILPNTDDEGAAHAAGRLIEAVSMPCVIDRHELTITPSIGIAIFPDDGRDLDTLSRNADTAMYRAKREGRNTFRFFTHEMQLHSARTLALANALHHALEREQLYLEYQPQVSLQDGRVVGAEALLRWSHPELGLISPAEFIHIAEGNGLILPIGEWVLRSALQQARRWADEGLPPLMLAVNLSAVQFRHPDLPGRVEALLAQTGVAPRLLELELTEAVAMEDPEMAIRVMNELDRHGVRIAIDDFGTGYSSLSYLKRFRAHKLKIDQSFVRDIIDDPDDKAIVTAIIHLAFSLEMLTIAEGVESAGQLDFLKLHGCDEVQGYHFSRPLPPDAFADFVRREEARLTHIEIPPHGA